MGIHIYLQNEGASGGRGGGKALFISGLDGVISKCECAFTFGVFFSEGGRGWDDEGWTGVAILLTGWGLWRARGLGGECESGFTFLGGNGAFLRGLGVGWNEG
ncbi:MAG TPA: hypothetical protein DGA22_00860 [Acidobacterium sp.]|nr:hypothetical protein [Acidobacterium sp.]